MTLFLRLYDSFISSQLFGFSSFGYWLLSSWEGCRFLLILKQCLYCESKLSSIHIFCFLFHFSFVQSLINTFIHVYGETLQLVGFRLNVVFPSLYFWNLQCYHCGASFHRYLQCSDNVLSMFVLKCVSSSTKLTALSCSHTAVFDAVDFLSPLLNIHISFSSGRDVNNASSLFHWLLWS